MGLAPVNEDRPLILDNTAPTRTSLVLPLGNGLEDFLVDIGHAR